MIIYHCLHWSSIDGDTVYLDLTENKQYIPYLALRRVFLSVHFDTLWRISVNTTPVNTVIDDQKSLDAIYVHNIF